MKEHSFKNVFLSELEKNSKVKFKNCNLCGSHFKPHSVFQRFCGRCKEKEEILKFGDWLPELDESLALRSA